MAPPASCAPEHTGRAVFLSKLQTEAPTPLRNKVIELTGGAAKHFRARNKVNPAYAQNMVMSSFYIHALYPRPHTRCVRPAVFRRWPSSTSYRSVATNKGTVYGCVSVAVACVNIRGSGDQCFDSLEVSA